MGQDAVHGVPRLLSDQEKHSHDHEHLDIDDLVTYKKCQVFFEEIELLGNPEILLRYKRYLVILRYF